MTWTQQVAAMVARNSAKFGESITYTRVTRAAFSSSTMSAAVSNATSILSATPGPVALRDLGPGKGRVEECRFSVKTADLPSGADCDDTVTDAAGRAWDVVDMPRRCMGTVTDLVCQRTAAG